MKSDITSTFNNVRHISYPENPFKTGMQSNVKITNNFPGVGYHYMLSMKYNIGDVQKKIPEMCLQYPFGRIAIKGIHKYCFPRVPLNLECDIQIILT